MHLKPASSQVEAKLKMVTATIDSLKQNPTERWKTIKLLTRQQQHQQQQQVRTKQQQNSLSSQSNNHSPPPDHPAAPIWTQRMETLFGPLNDQLRLIKCDHCGILTRETNSKVGVTHKRSRLDNPLLLPPLPLANIILFFLISDPTSFPRHHKKHETGWMQSIVRCLKNQARLGPSNSKKRASSEGKSRFTTFWLRFCFLHFSQICTKPVSLDSLPMKKKKKTTIIDHTQPPGGIDPDAPNVINGIPMTQKQIKKALAAAERADREAERKKKKKLEEEARKAKKLSRAKGGPVNVNEQCGVLTHSMGAKRSVPGRSAPYDSFIGQDFLYLSSSVHDLENHRNEWQKKNNPNWGDRKVVTPRVGPGIEPGLSKKKKKELASLANKNSSNNGNNKRNENDASSSSNNNNSNNKNQVGNGSSGHQNNKSGQVKDKDKSSHSAHHTSKSGNGEPKSSAVGGNASGTNKKSSGHAGLSSKGEARTTSAKLSAVNEAKLLGELDADFYLVVPPKKSGPKNVAVTGAVRPGPMDKDGDTAMGEPAVDAPAPPEWPLPKEQIEDDDEGSGNESDEEFEAVIRGLIVSQSLLKPVTLLPSEPLARNPFPPPSACSLRANHWSKFAKLGVKESFRNSFKL
ncbi:SAGA-associated factor 73 [Puccinia sorghi]|uniref:SAGA-associated factor 73 n=1 Tax=Puccinia sorghi TaxID=27349 RepID=A0A0L6VEU7_9BASI|nr:SAGA-associated factor 73 [Puccinia sorghi]